MSFNVIENVVPIDIQNAIENRFLGSNFPLFLNDRSVDLDYKTAFSDAHTKDGYRLNHSFVRDGQLVSNEWGLIEPIALALVNAIGLKPKIASCKLNLTFPNPEFGESDHFPAHFDTTDKAVVAVYYVNNSDGDTLFFSGKNSEGIFEISDAFTPKKGAIAYFNETTLHANRPPMKSRARCIINFNFLLDF